MTWAGNLASKAQTWAVLARMEGVGTYVGQYTFCTSAPAYGDSTYLELMQEPPSILSERAGITGGIPDAGACSVELVDGSDVLTQTMRTDRGPITRLASDVTASATEVTLGSSAALTAELSVLHIGSEAMAVDYFDGGGYATFDSIGDYVNYGAINELGGDSSATWSAWMNFPTAGDSGRILSVLGSTGGGWSLDSYLNTGLQMIIRNSGVNASVYTAAGEISTGSWHHICAVYASSAITLYVNGSTVSTTPFGTIPATIESPTGTWALLLNETSGLAAQLKHAAYWSGAAATSGQVAEIYNSGNPPNLNSLATFGAPTWWVSMDTDFVPEVGAASFTINGAPTFGTGTPSTTVSVTRGHLDTPALAHKSGDPVHLSPTYIAGRRMLVYLVPITGSTSSDETLVGTYLLESYGMSDDMNVWTFDGVSQLRYLDRQAPIAARDGVVRRLSGEDNVGVPWLYLEPTSIRQVWPDGNRLVNLSIDREIVGCENLASAPGASVPENGPRTLRLLDRGLFGTKTSDPEAGETVRQVMLAGRDFRVSPGPSPSTARGTPTWTPTTNWVDMVLCVMLSSASDDDGFELTNYRTSGTDWSRSNFSALPVGYGLGIPESLIDWAAWEDVRNRTQAYRFPYVVYGAEPVTFAEWITENFLRPLGAFLSVESGTVSVVMTRVPTAGSTTTITLGPDEILMRPAARGQALPRATVRRDKAQAFGELVYEVGPTGLKQTVTNETFAATFGQRGFYGASAQPLRISVPGGDPTTADLFAARGAALLYRRQRPPVSIECDASMEAFVAVVGDTATVTLDEAPNMEDATRGISGRLAQVLEREVRLEGGPGGGGLGAHMRMRVETYGDRVRVGIIAPSADVASVSVNTATVTANRYTHTDALGGLPTTDAAAFTVNDVVKLMSRDGAELASGATETVDGISGNDLTLSGNFSGALAAGTVLTYADRDDTTATQAAKYVHLADGATQTVGATAQTPWIWGES